MRLLDQKKKKKPNPQILAPFCGHTTYSALPGYIRKQWTNGYVPDTESLSQVNVPHLDSLLRCLVSSFGLGFLSFKLELSEADSDSLVFLAFSALCYLR